MKNGQLELLVLADVHYVQRAEHVCAIPNRKASFGEELAVRAVRDAQRQFQPDAIVLMGDLVDNGRAKRAGEDLEALHRALAAFGKPLVVVPGNHDGEAQAVMDVFGDRPGPHPIGGFNLHTFADRWDSADRCRRDNDAMLGLRQAMHPDRPTLVFQHNPVYPAVDDPYPFMIEEADRIRQAYASTGVLLSASGHYHRGQPLCRSGGTYFVTAPALSEAPHGYVRVSVSGRRVTAAVSHLQLPEPASLWDGHAHTEFAYCGQDIAIESVLARGALLGLGGIVFTEHAGQLYLPADEFWSARHLQGRRVLAEAVSAGQSRTAAYRKRMEAFRGERVRAGLEVECDDDGLLTLLDGDREGWDRLVGAVRWLPPRLDGNGPREQERGFMKTTEQLLAGGVDVLAHPWRYFLRRKLRMPKHLFAELAAMLAQYGVAAEINFHTNAPDPAFFALCVERGVKIALASDAHNVVEVADFHPHLRLLRSIAGSANLGSVLLD